MSEIKVMKNMKRTTGMKEPMGDHPSRAHKTFGAAANTDVHGPVTHTTKPMAGSSRSIHHKHY